MKNTILITLVMLFSITATQMQAQKLTAGKKLGKIKLGMTQQKAEAILGAPESTFTYQEEVQSYESMGYEIAEELPFFVGFDVVLHYNNNADSKIAVPVFKLFFKGGKLVYVIATSYGYSAGVYDGVKMKNGIKFHTSEKKVEGIYGKGKITPLMDGEYHTEYFSEGIGFAMDNYVVRAIHLFAPLSDDQIEKFNNPK